MLPGLRRSLRLPRAGSRPAYRLVASSGVSNDASPATRTPVKVAVTGAAGQIGYSLLFRLANGDLLGKDTPIELRLLEITPALKTLEGVVMELDDCAFPTLAKVEIGDDPRVVFDGVSHALLVGARPRGPGMERGDLLEANGGIFAPQGKALNEVAADDVQISVTGNPANTNALIAMSNAPDIPNERFAALTRLDHNRAISQLAAKLGVPVTDIRRMTIWGNHSATQYPDIFHAEVNGRNAAELVNDEQWLADTFIPTVAKRGAAIIDARGSSSAASAASATIDSARTWRDGTAEGDWVSMAVCSDGSYGVPEGLDVVVPGDHRGRSLVDRPGAGDQRVLAGADRQDRRRARGGARGRQGPRPPPLRSGPLADGFERLAGDRSNGRLEAGVCGSRASRGSSRRARRRTARRPGRTSGPGRTRRTPARRRRPG